MRHKVEHLPFLFSSLLEMNDNKVTIVSFFDSKGHADLASGPIGFWVRAALGDYILKVPAIPSG